MDKRLAKNSDTTAASTTFSLCVARLTQAHATVEGKNTENLPSVDKRGRLLTVKIKRIITSICSAW